MSYTTNAHAGTPGGSAYGYVVCCGGVEGLGTNCSGLYDTVLTLSATDNAHVASDGSYGTGVCLSVAPGDAADCTYGASCGSPRSHRRRLVRPQAPVLSLSKGWLA